MNPLVFVLPNSPIRAMIAPRLCYFHAFTLRSDLFLLLICWKPKPIPGNIYCAYLTVTMAPLVQIEPNDSEFLFSRKPVIAYLRHVFAGRFLSKRLRIWPSHLKPISEMGSFTFHADSFFRNHTVSEIHLVLWREKFQNFFCG
jgi:hypothetical protein